MKYLAFVSTVLAATMLGMFLEPLYSTLYYGFGYLEYGYLIAGIVLSVLSTRLWLDAFKKPREHDSKGLKAFGIVFIILGALGIMGSDSFDWINNTMIGSSFILSGYLFTKLSKGTKSPESRDVPDPDEQEVAVSPVEASKTTKTLNLLRRAAQTQSAKQNPAFKKNLEDSARFLSELEKEKAEMPDELLSQIEEILKFYLDLEDNQIQTPRTEQILEKIRNAFSMVRGSLEEIYDRFYNQKDFKVDVEIKTLEMKLRADGLIQDFKSDSQAGTDQA